MLQFRPGHGTQVVWNDREGDRFVCRLKTLNPGSIESGPRMRTIPEPIYTLAPDGKTALNADFRRIDDLRPGYGYARPGRPVRRRNSAPDGSGVKSVDLDTGESDLIFGIAEAAAIEPRDPSMDRAKHYFNHLLYNPAGDRFIVLPPVGGRTAGRPASAPACSR